MLRNQNIICFSSIDWDFVWQGHQEIMSTLAKNNNKVFFIENTGIRVPNIKDIPRIKNRLKNWFRGIKGIRKEADNLYIFSPLILPFPYFRVARWINRLLILSVMEKWMKVLDFTDPIIWVFLPTGFVLDLVDNINKKLLIYYCLDNFKLVSPATKRVEKYEKKIIQKSDLVFVTSDNLYKYCSNFADKIYKFAFSVNIAQFDKNKIDNFSAPQDLRGIRRPIIGFSGGIRKWIDKDLLKYLSDSNPEYSFVFIGPLQMDVEEFVENKNMHFLGQKDHNELPRYINNFDVSIIPYLVNDFTQCIYPAKLNEYLALGKPVVSTALPELISLRNKYQDIVYIADTKEEFKHCIKRALANTDKALIDKRIEFARKNSWENYIEEMSKLIEEAIEIKNLDREAKWKENLIVFYRTARKKMIRLTSICLLIYLIIFYTPLVWFLAEPLRISGVPPGRTDAIVVLAGGVGESGKAGQGYEERVGYAVELYKKGYANRLIFSSGYTYVFEEPFIMKALAISLGVPESAIILEDKATNTYENVKFSKLILDKNSWNNIILISSPYHMLRVSLVFNAIAKDINVTYSPIPNSLFYSHPDRDISNRKIWKRVNILQIKGILHEYIGILYYWWKGYI